MSDLRPLLDDAHRFGPAAPDETVVYGACAPNWHTAAAHEPAVDQWLVSMHDQGIERVCCLLTGRQLDDQDANIGQYRAAFGEDAVLHAPIPDRRLVDAETLTGTILPFLDAADDDDAPVVVHCLTGIGRTGHVLAAWLVHGRGHDPQGAIETVREMGRDPMEPVEQGEISRQDVLDLLEQLS